MIIDFIKFWWNKLFGKTLTFEQTLTLAVEQKNAKGTNYFLLPFYKEELHTRIILLLANPEVKWQDKHFILTFWKGQYGKD